MIAGQRNGQDEFMIRSIFSVVWLCLALAANAFVSPRAADAAASSGDDLAQLFQARLAEATERAMDRGG